MKTPFEENLQKVPYEEYPRPQFKRDSYLSLNGLWDLEIKKKNETIASKQILVPFPPESRLSGIERITQRNETLIYTRNFSLPEGFCKERVLLHFGAADQSATVYLNDQYVGEHESGYLPFFLDITNYLQEKNCLRVEVRDPMDRDLPWGKQRYKRGGMWYTPISGLWQSVWLESIPAHAITFMKITPSLDRVLIQTEGGTDEKTIRLESGECYKFSGDQLEICIENPHHWSPEDPYLYRFTLESGADRIESYFALRTISIKNNHICLNGRPYFFHGLLDQGYFSDGIYLPATTEGFKNDILQAKALGFNMLRKHIKIEPDLFYYYCDLYGMVVFQDMVNSGGYSFLLDTALPTVFLRKGIRHRVTERRKRLFIENNMEMMLLHLYNHPSVCYYTIFNEGWGQFDADYCYSQFKKADPTRIFDSTSGWFKETLSDVESEHVYFKPIRLKLPSEKPTVLSEFGGYSCRIQGHIFNPDKNYGYKYTTKDPKIFEQQLLTLYDKEVLPAVAQGLNGAVLTQLSDVEDETNGLLTYDRKVCKVQPEAMQALSMRLKNAFNQKNIDENIKKG